MTEEYSIKLVGIIVGTGLALDQPYPWPTGSQEGRCSPLSLVVSFGPMSSSIWDSSCWGPPERVEHFLIHYYIYHSRHQTSYQNCLIFLMKKLSETDNHLESNQVNFSLPSMS